MNSLVCSLSFSRNHNLSLCRRCFFLFFVVYICIYINDKLQELSLSLSTLFYDDYESRAFIFRFACMYSIRIMRVFLLLLRIKIISTTITTTTTRALAYIYTHAYISNRTTTKTARHPKTKIPCIHLYTYSCARIYK